MARKSPKLLLADGNYTSSWVKLKDLKESFPVQLAEYAVGNKIAEEPAFAWWVPYTIRKRDRIISKVKSKYWKRTHKFGIRLPKMVKEAMRFDKEDETDICQKAIEKEMKNVRVAFEFNEEDKMPVGHSEIRLHWVFNIKMDSLQRKAWLVANGNETDLPKDMTYSLVTRYGCSFSLRHSTIWKYSARIYKTHTCKRRSMQMRDTGPKWGLSLDRTLAGQRR
jgi:hypothetical protein